ncbi:hypothetical protein [Heyndrickxia faecalis]|uniref:hypothetical protein n=1 Tax=Heyndrickxia faecalis TaxID=2824910 RepID=UPI003D1A79C6
MLEYDTSSIMKVIQQDRLHAAMNAAPVEDGNQPVPIFRAYANAAKNLVPAEE